MSSSDKEALEGAYMRLVTALVAKAGGAIELDHEDTYQDGHFVLTVDTIDPGHYRLSVTRKGPAAWDAKRDPFRWILEDEEPRGD